MRVEKNVMAVSQEAPAYRDDERRAKVFILDSDLSVIQSFASMADTDGREAKAFRDPTAFLNAVDSQKPEYVAIDLSVPEMDGVEVVHRLASMGCAAGIIIMSGLGECILRAAELSANEHGLHVVGALSKPFSLAMLSASLNAPASKPPPSRLKVSNRQLMAVDTELESALRNDELFMVYQPKIDCRSHALAGFEALVRWQHPQRGVVMPDFFIPVAERSELIDRITHRVIQKSLAWYASNQQHWMHFSSIKLSINLSAANLRNIKLADFLVEACAIAGVPCDNVILEVTETSAMEDPRTSLDLMTRLRMKGFMLSLDDFGTGYSSMAQLVRLPFSEIKVDKSFVMTLKTSNESQMAVRSIVELGRSLRLQTTAEGVEDEHALTFLRDLGCDLAQGYHIAKPMPGDSVPLWIKSRQSQHAGSHSAAQTQSL